MSEPLQGHKTNIQAALFVLLQAAQAAGFVDAGTAQLVEQGLAFGMAVTLALKARRATQGK